jgi:hypothetical protein
MQALEAGFFDFSCRQGYNSDWRGGGGMADAADLNSAGPKGRVGSTPIRPILFMR